ncbi:MAG: PAS domain S-box protein [Candidatus Omnitrophica bacterium]|nr:PAS domain S-box protein [Candidatus Omnitrophota bacterium]
MKYLMIITEDKSIVHSLKIILKDYIVEDVKPVEVIEKIKERQPFLIFLDTYLNEIDPCELIDKILEEDDKILIVPLISCYDKKAKEILEKEIFEIIEKPYLIEKLFLILKKAEKWVKVNIKEVKQEENKEVFKDEKDEKKDLLFQMFFDCITENFLDIKKACSEIVKNLRRYFHFNYISLFLKEGPYFKIYSSIGIDEKFCEKIRLTFDDPIIKWFVEKGKIINIKEKIINIDLKNFSSILKCSLIFPLRTFNGKLVGFFSVGEKSTNEEITKEEISLLNTLSDYLAIIFDNFFLYNEINYQKKYQEFIFQNLPIGILVVDKDGIVNFLNREGEKILKTSFLELKGNKIEKIGSQIADLFRRSLLYGETVSRKEFEFLPTKTILGISTNIMKDENGNLVGVVGIFRDLTEIKEIEKKKENFERDKFWSAISFRLSHELKNPLVAINTFAQMLPTMYDDKEFREKFSEIVVKEIKKINEIVDWINKIGETVELKKEVIFLDKFIEDFINNTGINRKNQKNLTKKIEVDIIKLKEAFNYLIEFLKDAAKEEGEISINIDEKDDIGEIVICKKGKNFPFEREEEIFIPFNPKIKTSLSIKILLAKKIIEAHQGTLKAIFNFNCKDFVINLPLKNE